MNNYHPTQFRHKLVIAALTLVLGGGMLELVAGGMRFPDPETMAMRERVIAMEAERAQQIRALERGEVRYAGSVTVNVR